VGQSNKVINQKLDEIAGQLGKAEKHIIQEVANIRASKPIATEPQNEPKELQVRTLAEDL